MSDKPLRCTQSFLRDYATASGPLAHLAEQEVHFLLRRIRSEPATWIRRYDRVEGIDETVLELEVGGGPRLLLHVNGAMTLCRLGGHDIVSRTVKSKSLIGELQRSVPAPPQFMPEHASPLFPTSSGKRTDVYGAELVPEWVYWLDDEQARLGIELVESLENALLESKPAQHMVLGGPGTGKTTILTWLLQHLCAVVPESRESFDVRLVASPRLLDYVRRSTHWHLDEVLRPVSEGSPDVILVDDPTNLRSLPNASGASRVVAVYPLQLLSPVTDSDLESLERRWAMHWLHACYRQKELVGLSARHVMDVVAASSPFLDDTKQKTFARERADITRRSNAMTYPNPTGRVRTHAAASREDWIEHVEWLQEQRRMGRTWSHWPSVLLVVDDTLKPPTGWIKELAGIAKDRIRLSELEKVKGLEYQHVVMLLTRRTFRRLNEGFAGSGRSEYRTTVRMRIPFTRARDSIATFAV